MIQTITEKAPSIMIDSQALLSFCRKAANTAVYLNQRTPKEGLTRRDSRNGYHAPYPTPYEMLQALGKPSHNNDGNEISYKAPLHHLQRFGCYASRLIPEPQLVLATGLGNQPAVQFSPAVCFSSVHYPAKNPTQVDLAGVLPRPDWGSNFTVPTTFPPIKYLSSDHVMTCSVCILCSSTRSFAYQFPICDPTDIR